MNGAKGVAGESSAERSQIQLLLLTILMSVQVVYGKLTADVFRGSGPALSALHGAVLNGDAPAAYQYRYWPLAQLAERLFGLFPLRHPSNGFRLLLVYDAIYWLGALLFLAVLYFWLQRFGSPLASLTACMVFVSMQPLFWWDNPLIHPSDPWGLLLATLMLQRIYEKRESVSLLMLALLSGFVWEKHVLLLPVYALYVKPWRKKTSTLFAIALILASCIGQIAYRVYFGTNRPWVGSTVAENLSASSLIRVAVGYGLLAGLPLA